MDASRQIRSLISLYLADLLDLSLLADRFSDLFENIEDSNDSVAIQLSYQVEAVLAKASDGLISESQFRADLSPLAVVPSAASISYPVPSRPLELQQAFGVGKDGQLIPLELVGN